MPFNSLYTLYLDCTSHSGIQYARSIQAAAIYETIKRLQASFVFVYYLINNKNEMIFKRSEHESDRGPCISYSFILMLIIFLSYNN